MSVDIRTASMLSTIRHNLDATIPYAEDTFAASYAPSPSDSRRLALLMEETGLLAAALAAGHGSIDVELERLGGHVTAWLLARERERAR